MRFLTMRTAEEFYFYAEHGAVFIIGLCCIGRFGWKGSASNLLIAVPLIAISVARMLLFNARRKMGKSVSMRQLHSRPESRTKRNEYIQRPPLQNGGGR